MVMSGGPEGSAPAGAERVTPDKPKRGRGRPRLPEPEVGADDPDPAVMTLDQVAEHLDCSYATVLLRVMRDGLLPFRLDTAGDRWRVRRSDLEQWIAERKVQPAGRPKTRKQKLAAKEPVRRKGRSRK